MKTLFVFAAILALAAAQRGTYEKRSPEPQYGGRPVYPSWYPYYGNYAPNTANQVSNANSGYLGTSIASGTSNANQYRPYRDTPLSELSTEKPKLANE